jgi:outer membrane immunogenic protein
MRFSVLLGVTTGLFAGAAFAADIGPVEPLPTPEVAEAAPANDWTGFYLGALGGYNWGEADTDTVGDVDVDGFDIGGYAGANWQWGNFVIGAEADLLHSFADGGSGGVSVDQGLHGSLRGRIGVALDQFLLYGTAGAAGAELELSGGGASDDEALWGWTAGAGIEAMLLDNITARIEYRYTDYEDETFTLGGGDVESDLTTHAVRGGLGLKF